MGGMTSQPIPWGPLVTLGFLAALLMAAGLLPWLDGGSAAARGFATPLVLMGAFAGYAVLRAGTNGRAGRSGLAGKRQAARAPATQGPPAGCGGCGCGAGGCGAVER